MKAPAALRRRIALELGGLALASAVFLGLFPQRAGWVDLSLALVALTLVAVSARRTRQIWALYPPPARQDRVRRAWIVTLGITAILTAGVLALGAGLAWRQGGAEEVRERLLNPGILLALAIYFLWALLQQTLFQFYLLGRLRTLLPPAGAIGLTGAGYALVHLPDVGITGVTVVTGVVWTSLYHRYRTLVPLALSHAVLGAAFYYWVYGRDLAAEWLGLG